MAVKDSEPVNVVVTGCALKQSAFGGNAMHQRISNEKFTVLFYISTNYLQENLQIMNPHMMK